MAHSINFLTLTSHFLGVVTIVMAFFYMSSSKVNYSILLTAVIGMLGDYLVTAFSPFNTYITDPHWRSFAWFIGLALFDMLMIYVILFAHTRIGLLISNYARLVMACYALLGFVQIITYFDHAHLKTGVVLSFYKIFIPAFSISMTLGLAVYLAWLLYRPNPLQRYMS